jgi:hypothetical protein
LLGLPVPGVFLSREDLTGKLLVIDGQQRLKTLEYFYDGSFPGEDLPFELSGVQSEFSGSTYSKLSQVDRRRLDNSILHATVVKQDVPSDDDSSIYHLFARLNTGGMQLTQQEIRACIYHGALNEYLHRLNENVAWRRVYGKQSKRMRDQELLLRFFAFFFEPGKFERSLNDFLNKYMARNRSLNRQSAEKLDSVFIPTIELIENALGREAFRPRTYLNAAVFDAVAVGVARSLAGGNTIGKASLRRRYDRLVSSRKFQDATEFGTNAAQSVKDRIALATKAFSGSR